MATEYPIRPSTRIWIDRFDEPLSPNPYCNFKIRTNFCTGESWVTLKRNSPGSRQSYNLSETGVQVEYYPECYPPSQNPRYREWPLLIISPDTNDPIGSSFLNQKREHPLIGKRRAQDFESN